MNAQLKGFNTTNHNYVSCFKKFGLILMCFLAIATITTRNSDLSLYLSNLPTHEQPIPKDVANTTVATKVVEISDIEGRMRDRILHMKDVCSKYGLDVRGQDSLHRPDPWEYIINKEHKMIWCNVFKSSSTSWMYVFNILAGYDPKFLNRTKKVPLQMARDKYGRPKLEDMQSLLHDNESVSFIVGRNPFERLVSGYRDKIQNSFPRSVHDKIRRTIASRYRNAKLPPMGRSLPKNMIPTFTEFVAYIVEEHRAGKELDMHWSPVYSFCTPCQFNLGNIILYATQTEDTKYILKKAKVFDKIGGVLSLNPSKGSSSTHNTTSYFVAQLPKQLFYDLVQLYMIDFELFGFKIPEFEDYKGYRKPMDGTDPMPTTKMMKTRTPRG